jgi:hypothetical protein
VAKLRGMESTDRRRIRYFHEMQNEQFDVYRRLRAKYFQDAEITRLTQENERMRRENADLLGSLGDLYNLISDSNAPTFIADADYDKITNAAVLISLATPIPDPAGGMPVETIWYETRRNEEPDGGMPVEVTSNCPVCHDDAVMPLILSITHRSPVRKGSAQGPR